MIMIKMMIVKLFFVGRLVESFSLHVHPQVVFLYHVASGFIVELVMLSRL